MFTFTFDEITTKTIGGLLEQAPYKIAAPILAEMQRQITAQQKPPEPVPPAPPAPAVKNPRKGK